MEIENEHSTQQAYERNLLSSEAASVSTENRKAMSVEQCAEAALNVFRALVTKIEIAQNNGAAKGFSRIAGTDLCEVRAIDLLTERARFLGFTNPGRISANQYCRLIDTTSGWMALNLARDEDWELIPAWLETEVPTGSWHSIEALLSTRCGVDLVARGRLMGLPVSLFNSIGAESWFSIQKRGRPAGLRKSAPLVIDLSSLWAGPLCSHLLQLAGATVLKIESSSRPDSTQLSSPEFHRQINSGKLNVALDFNKPEGVRQLLLLIHKADIVIEGSRPRALRQLGIDAESCVKQIAGLTWVSITGYGRQSPQENWIAFGDDAAIAGGLAAIRDGVPYFVGDAVADPLTGIHAAVAALNGWSSGVGTLVDVSLAGVASYVCQHVENVEPIIPPVITCSDLFYRERRPPVTNADTLIKQLCDL